MTLEEARRLSAQLNRRLSESAVLHKVFQIARKIEGLPRHTSTHAARVVLSKEPLSEVVPLQEGHDGVYLTQYAMDHLEDLGLLKMDFLGLRNLTLIESIKTMIEKETNTKIDFSEISYQDEKTFSLLSNGDTTGIFQLESSGMRNVLKRLKPSRLEDIVAVNALYRRDRWKIFRYLSTGSTGGRVWKCRTRTYEIFSVTLTASSSIKNR